MPYSYPKNIPRPAKNWPAADQKKCIAAANAVLADGGSEQSAIFACIRAAGRTEHPGGKTVDPINALSEGIKSLFMTKATWSTAAVNDLPDASFLFVESGGKKVDGKTTPRSLRHFPYKDADGQVDMPHLRNAIARIPQSSLEEGLKKRLQKRAQAMLEHMNEGKSIEAIEKELSLDQEISVIRDAWYAKRPRNADGKLDYEVSWPYVREVYDSYVIVEGKDGLQKVPYGKTADGDVDFGEPVKVEVLQSTISGADECRFAIYL